MYILVLIVAFKGLLQGQAIQPDLHWTEAKQAFHDVKGCPLHCKCQIRPLTQDLVVNCTSKSLQKIPMGLPDSTTHLLLSHNQLVHVEGELILLKNLRFLDLSYNKLKYLWQNSLKSQAKLVDLRLNNNELTFDSSSVPEGSFSALGSLTHLSINNNAWRKQQSYRDDLFYPLSNLKTLELDGLPSGKRFGTGFSKLHNVTYLGIHEGFNYISNSTFENLAETGLQILNISSGNLYDTEQLAFSHLHNLTHLVLDDNMDLGFVNVSKAWYGLQFTDIQYLSLQRAAPVVTDVITLTKVFFVHLDKTELKTLLLDKNNIITLDSSLLSSHLPYLEVLSLSYNNLQLINELVYQVSRLRYLKYISVANQYRRYPVDANLHNMGYMGQASFSAFRKQPLGRSWTIWDGPWFIPVGPNLEYALLGGSINYQMDNLPKSFIIGHSQVKYLDYSDNGLKNLSGPFNINNSEKVEFGFNLSNNAAHYLSPYILSESIQYSRLNVTLIDLANNALGKQLETDIEGEIFSSFKDLQYLNLSGNTIKRLPKSVFSNLTRLKVLNLAKNSLRVINLSLRNLTSLEKIDLSNNLFSSIDKAAFKQLKNVTIDMSGNPLVCSCETLDFLIRINRTDKYVQFKNHLHYECSYNNDIVTLKDFYDHDLSKLVMHCKSKAAVIAAVVIFGCAIICFATTVVIYRHRWDIKFFFIKYDRKRKKHQDIQECDSFKYDAFVAYHVNDIKWVKEVLLQELENDEGAGADSGISTTESNDLSRSYKKKFKVCVHHRDFLPGRVIEENIIESINQSFKTILVLTNNFVTSEWCEFELQMARMRCFDKGRDIIVVIMLEPVPASAMSSTLRTLIKRTTYISWPEKMEDEPLFWEKLKCTLRAPEVAPLVCECGRYVQKCPSCSDY